MISAALIFDLFMVARPKLRIYKNFFPTLFCARDGAIAIRFFFDTTAVGSNPRGSTFHFRRRRCWLCLVKSKYLPS